MTVVCQACVVVHVIITHQGCWYLPLLIIRHDSCFTGTKKHNPYQRSFVSLKRRPPTSLTDQILAVCLFLMTNSLAQHTRESLSRPAHFNSPHFLAVFTPTATHIHKGMVLILFLQLLLKGNTSAQIGLHVENTSQESKFQ